MYIYVYAVGFDHLARECVGKVETVRLTRFDLRMARVMIISKYKAVYIYI